MGLFVFRCFFLPPFLAATNVRSGETETTEMQETAQ